VIGAAVYVLCTVTSALCAVLLLRQYGRTRVRLLFWSGLSFVGFAISNALVFADFVVLPQRDLSLLRAATALASIAILLCGLLLEGE
jgi:hypothetical protein